MTGTEGSSRYMSRGSRMIGVRPPFAQRLTSWLGVGTKFAVQHERLSVDVQVLVAFPP